MKKLLVERYQFNYAVTKDTLTEDFASASSEDAFPNDGVLIVEGLIQRSDIVNQNGRYYPRAIWQQWLASTSAYMRRVKEREIIGELDHPEDNSTKLKRGAVLILDLRLNEDGTVWGRFEVLPTTDGKQLAAYFKRKVKVGISSRALGETRQSERGEEVIPESFELETWDFVYNPSTAGAYPTVASDPMTESVTLTEKENVPMDFTSQYKALEEAVKELLQIDVSKVPLSMHPVLTRQVNSLMVDLSGISEKSADIKPLATGLLTEVSAVKSLLLRSSSKPIREEEDLPPEVLKTVLPKVGEGTVETPPVVEPPKTVEATDKPKEPKKVKVEDKRMKTNKKVLAIAEELEDVLSKTEEDDPAIDQAKADAVDQVETRLYRMSKSVTEQEGDEEDYSDIPAPPAVEEEDDEEELSFTDDDGEEVPLTATESKLLRIARRAVRENKQIKWRLAVTEKVAAYNLRRLATEVRRTKVESTGRTSSIKVGSTVIPVERAASVIEGLARRVKEVEGKGSVREGAEGGEFGGLPIRTSKGGPVVESLAKRIDRKPKSPLSEQASLGRQLMSRQGSLKIQPKTA